MNIGIGGAGSLGTAIAQLIANNGINEDKYGSGVNLDNVFLYARRSELSNQINENNANNDYFPTLDLNNKIIGVKDLFF